MRIACLLPAALILTCASSAAAAPPNDNYLASKTINAPNGTLAGEYHDRQDTTFATTQSDLFNPDKNGAPLGGGPAEMTACAGAIYGRTVWYDFATPSSGAIQLVAAGYEAIVRVYEWDPKTSQITRTVLCRHTASGPVSMQARRNASYTVQIGGVNGRGGPLNFGFWFYADSDDDGVLDEAPDRCPGLPGISAAGGCPPLARGTPRLAYDRVGGGIRIASLVVDRVAKGAKVSVSCRRCGRKVTRTASRAGSLRLRGFVGRRLRSGDTMELRITQRRAGAGRYRYGAIGRLFRWRVRSTSGQRLARLSDSCLAPGATRKKMRCP